MGFAVFRPPLYAGATVSAVNCPRPQEHAAQATAAPEEDFGRVRAHACVFGAVASCRCAPLPSLHAPILGTRRSRGRTRGGEPGLFDASL